MGRWILISVSVVAGLVAPAAVDHARARDFTVGVFADSLGVASTSTTAVQEGTELVRLHLTANLPVGKFAGFALRFDGLDVNSLGYEIGGWIGCADQPCTAAHRDGDLVVWLRRPVEAGGRVTLGRLTLRPGQTLPPDTQICIEPLSFEVDPPCPSPRVTVRSTRLEVDCDDETFRLAPIPNGSGVRRDGCFLVNPSRQDPVRADELGFGTLKARFGED